MGEAARLPPPLWGLPVMDLALTGAGVLVGAFFAVGVVILVMLVCLHRWLTFFERRRRRRAGMESPGRAHSVDHESPHARRNP